jgi:hypothetical protein
MRIDPYTDFLFRCSPTPYLERFCQLHDVARVEAGLEQVGADALFISRPAGDRAAVELYSRRPSIVTERLQ